MTFFDPFLEAAVVLSVAAVLGAIAHRLRQTLIIVRLLSDKRESETRSPTR